jgi:hypothetical protein
MRRWLTFLMMGLILVGQAPPARSQTPGAANLDQFTEQAKQSQLSQAIGVDQRTVDLLIQIDRRYKPQKAKLKQEMSAELNRLQQVLRQPNPPQEEVRAILNSMFQKRQETLALQQRQLEEEMAILNPVQQGRYLLFLMGLRKQIAKEALNLRGAPPAAGTARPARPGMGQEIPAVQPTP